jgi:ABC-2 type transport system permease protein
MKRVSPEWFLWKKRFLYDLKQKKRALGLLIDWVVALYLIVPAIIIGSVLYIQGLQSPPAWWKPELVQAGLALLLLFPMLFNVRPLFSLGDEGILISSPLSPRRFIVYSWIQDMVIKLFLSIFLWGLLTPYLRLLDWSFMQIGGLAILWYLLNLFVVQNEWCWIGRNRWFHYFLLLLNALLLIWFWGFLIVNMVMKNYLLVAVMTMLLICTGIFFFLRNHRHRWAWSQLIQESVEKRIGFIALILEGNAKKSKVRVKKRRPARILKGGLGLPFSPENALFLWYIKSFLRTFDHYSTYIQAVIYSLFALMLIPIWWVSAIALAIVLFMLANLLMAPTKNLENPWFKIYPFTFTERRKGLTKGPLILNGFVGVAGSILVTYHAGNWIYLIPLALVAVGVAWISIEISA